MFKHCPECGQEYQHWVSRCTDCDVALVLAAGEPLAPVREERAPAPIADPVVLRLDIPAALAALAEALQEHGISSRIGPHEQAGARHAIYVARADLNTASAIAEELVARSLPDLDGMDVPEYDASSCPACGEPTPEHAAACAACGLAFPEVDPSTAPGAR